MSDIPAREMTLEEWVVTLPVDHLARKELTQLKAEKEALKELLKRANRFNTLSKIESAPAWDHDSPFQKDLDALLKGEDDETA